MKGLPYTQIMSYLNCKGQPWVRDHTLVYRAQHSDLYSQLFVSQPALVILAVGASPRAAGFQSVPADPCELSFVVALGVLQSILIPRRAFAKGWHKAAIQSTCAQDGSSLHVGKNGGGGPAQS